MWQGTVNKQSKVKVFGHSAGIIVSNPAGGMDVFLLWELCVIR